MGAAKILDPQNLPSRLPLPNSTIRNLEGEKFNRLTVQYYIGSENWTPYWLCRCDCGNYIRLPRTSITRKDKPTKSCGCLRRERVSQTRIKDLTGQKFNLLMVLRLSDKRTKSGHAMWECQCECGNITIVNSNNLQNGGVKSCGCYGRSKNEQIIATILKERDIPFITEYSFNDLLSNKGALLRFDFAVIDAAQQVKFLIEYQGIQHFSNSFKHSGEEYQLAQERDKMKHEYCRTQGIPLYEIRYNEDALTALLKILSLEGVL